MAKRRGGGRRRAYVRACVWCGWCDSLRGESGQSGGEGAGERESRRKAPFSARAGGRCTRCTAHDIEGGGRRTRVANRGDARAQAARANPRARARRLACADSAVANGARARRGTSRCRPPPRIWRGRPPLSAGQAAPRHPRSSCACGIGVAHTWTNSHTNHPAWAMAEHHSISRPLPAPGRTACPSVFCTSYPLPLYRPRPPPPPFPPSSPHFPP